MSAKFLAQQPTVDDQFTFMLKQFEKDDDFSRLMLVPPSLEEFKTELVSYLSCERNGTSAAPTIPSYPQIAREPVFRPKPRDSGSEELCKSSHLNIDDDLARIFDPTRALKPDMFTHPETRDSDPFREKLPHEFLAVPGDSYTSLDMDWNTPVCTSPVTTSDDRMAGIIAQHSVIDLRSGDVDMDMDLPDKEKRSAAEASELEKRMAESDRLTLAYKGPYIVSLFGRLYPCALRDSQDLFCHGVALQQDENPTTASGDANDGGLGASSLPLPSDDDSDSDSDSSGFVYTNISPPLSPNTMSVDRHPASPGYAWSSSSLSSPPGTLSGWSTGASDADVDAESISSVVSSPPTSTSTKRKVRQRDPPQRVKKIKLAARPAVAVVPHARARLPSPHVPEHTPTTQISSSNVPSVDIVPDVSTAAAAPLATPFLEVPPTTTGDEPTFAASRNAPPVNGQSSRPFIARAAQDNATAGPSTHKKKFPCPKEGCHQVCTSPGDLERHLESRAHKAPSYQCLAPDCSKKYTRIDALKRHHDHSPACKRQHREQQQGTP